MIVLNGEEGLDWIRLEHVSEFKYLGCVLNDESVRDEPTYSREIASGRKVAGVIRSLVNDKDLQV